MTNGEKIKEIFPQAEIIPQYLDMKLIGYDVCIDGETYFSKEWWNMEYCRPLSSSEKPNKSEIPASSTTKNNLGVDAISRQALLNATVKKSNIWNHITNSEGDNLEAIVSKLPPVTPQEPGWIPVSGRLPEEDEVVLGTNSSNDLFQTYTWDDCGEIKWYADGCFDVPVVAWMPLPKPYSEVESEDK